MTATPERARLREAQLEVQECERAVEEARRAAHHAQAKWSACNSTVGELTRELEDAEDEPTSSDRFIEQLAGGGDVLVETNRADELRKQIDEAEAESAIWAAGRHIAEQAVEARLHALDLAAHRVNEACRVVADKEVDVAAMLATAEAARQATLSAAANLMTVAKMLPQSSMRRHEIESFMQQGWHSPNAVERAAGGENYRAWFDELRADADAALKV